MIRRSYGGVPGPKGEDGLCGGHGRVRVWRLSASSSGCRAAVLAPGPVAAAVTKNNNASEGVAKIGCHETGGVTAAPRKCLWSSRRRQCIIVPTHGLLCHGCRRFRLFHQLLDDERRGRYDNDTILLHYCFYYYYYLKNVSSTNARYFYIIVVVMILSYADARTTYTTIMYCCIINTTHGRRRTCFVLRVMLFFYSETLRLTIEKKTAT